MSMRKIIATLLSCALALVFAVGFGCAARADGLLEIISGLQSTATEAPTAEPTEAPTEAPAFETAQPQPYTPPEDDAGDGTGLWFATFSPASDDTTATALAIAQLRARLMASGFAGTSISWFSDGQITVSIEGVTEADAPFAGMDATVSTIRFLDEDGNVLLSNGDIATATLKADGVLIGLTEAGTVAFSDATARNVGKTINIMLDDELLLAPRVQAPITGGYISITGNGIPAETIRLLIDTVNTTTAPIDGLILDTATFVPIGGEDNYG